MNNLLISIGVLIVLVLSALFAVPYFVDWNSWRGVIEEEASRMIGRDVRIGGDITAQLLPSPAFAIQKLRVADVSTGTGEPLFRAERFDVRLSIAPLFRGVLEASQIELVKPALRLVVDDAGHGNWRSIVQGQGALPFAPSAVALQSVKITDGSVSGFDQGGKRARLKLDHVDGQLSAAALEGPYRFRGTFGAPEAPREVRFTTVPPDADGLVQVKATLKDTASGATASLDGRVRNPSGQPELTGDLTAQLPIASPDPARKLQHGPVAELKAALVGTVRQIALNDLSLAFESSGRPEVLTGSATFNFEGELKTVAGLSAPWIDLDTVLGNPEGGNPLLALAEFAKRINNLSASVGRATATLQIDQANLGHDLVSGIRLEAQSNSGVLALDQLRANLPGGTKIEVLGRLAGDGGATTFDGDMTLRGSSLARLAAWATAGRTVIAPANDVPFQARSRVTAEPARGGLRNIVATIGESVLEGEVDYAWKGPRMLRVAIGGPRIDARTVAPQTTTLRALSDALSPAKGTADDLTVALSWRTPELVLTGQTLRDVSVSLESSSQGLRIERLQFSGDHGIAVSLEGRLGGELRGAIAVADAEGLSALSEFVDFPLSTLLPSAVKREAFPLRLAGTVTQSSAPASKSVDVVADGRTGNIDAKVRLTFAGGIGAWRTAPADIDVVLMGPPKARIAAKILEALSGVASEKAEDLVATALGAASETTSVVTRLAIRAVGVPADGLSTSVRFDSPDMGVLVDGQSQVPATGAIEVSGNVTLDARDAREAVDAITGVDLNQSEPLALQGSLQITSRNGAVSLTKIALASNGNSIAGRLDLDAPGTSDKGPAGAPQRRLHGDLTLSTLDAAAMLAPILQARSADTQAAIQVTSGRIGGWPDANFNFARRGGVVADIGLKAGKLTIRDGVTLRNAEFKLMSRPGALEISDLGGSALGGRVAFSAVLDRTPSGAALTAKVGFEGAQLANFGGSGASDFSLTLTGGGLNPAGLVSSLTGSGTMTLTAGSVREISPASLQTAIETAFKAPPDKLDSALKSALTEDGARGPVSLGPRTIALAVRDGALRIQPITVQSAPGRITAQAALDLATFQITGDWRVETRLPALPPLPPLPGQPVAPPAPTPAALLPALVQRFTLAPAEIGSTARVQPAAIDTSALERELAVRKVERDLAELERLRRLDEERAAAQKAAAEQADWARQTNVQSSGPVSAPPTAPAVKVPQ